MPIKTLNITVLRCAAIFVTLTAMNAGAHAHDLAQASQSALLDSLDKHIALAKKYEKNEIDRIGRLKLKMQTLPAAKQLPLFEDISNGYLRIDIDSALHYQRTGAALAAARGNEDAIWRLGLLQLKSLALRGEIARSIDNFERIDPRSLTPQTQLLYFETGRNLYWFANDYLGQDSTGADMPRKALAMTDSLLLRLSAESTDYKYYDALRGLESNTRDRRKSAGQAAALLNKLQPDDPRFAVVAAELAQYYNRTGDKPQAMRYWTMSAISDLITGNNETTSLHRLGKLIYEEDDIDRAFTYLTVSLEKSVASGARIRSLEAAQALPLVIATSNRRKKSNRTLMWIAMSAMAVLALTLLAFLANVLRHRLQLGRLNSRLFERHGSKDRYIRSLISLYAGYLKNFEDFNSTIARKIKASQNNDVLAMVQSGRMMRNQLQSFYEVFDPAFLDIFPDFVTQVNALMQPDRQYATQADGRFTPELRMLALMRIGVDDSQQISKFLGLSINTIYTYRNKAKNRALDRENFEKQLMSVGRIV